LRRSAEPNAADVHSHTPLERAARAGRAAVVALLLEEGQWGQHVRGYIWSTTLYLSIDQGRAKVVEAVLAARAGQEGGWDWSMEGDWQPTGLIRAVARGDTRIVDLLLARGADPRQKTYYRQSPLSEALRRKDAAMVQRLVEAGASLGFEEAVVAGDLVLAERFLREGADVEAPDRHGNTLLSWAAEHGAAAMARVMVRFGGRVQRAV